MHERLQATYAVDMSAPGVLVSDALNWMSSSSSCHTPISYFKSRSNGFDGIFTQCYSKPQDGHTPAGVQLDAGLNGKLRHD